MKYKEIPPRFRLEHILAHSFCVWLLLYDGMSVPPFDRHEDGSGLLRLHGLRPPTWDLLLQHALDIPAPFEQIGTPDLASYLARLWTSYARVHWQEWRSRYDAHRPQFLSKPHESIEFARMLQRDLDQVLSAVPLLTISLVPYPAPAIYPLRPATLVLGADHGDWDPTYIRTSIVQAALQLGD